MIIVLSRRFEALLAIGWFFVGAGTYILLWSDPSPQLHLWQLIVLSLLIFGAYLAVALSTIQVKLNGCEEIEYYWSVLGIRMGLKKISKAQVMELKIVMLSSHRNALILKLKSEETFVLLKGKNKKHLNKALSYYKVTLAEKPFFSDLKINSYPFEQYAQNRDLFKEDDTTNEDEA